MYVDRPPRLFQSGDLRQFLEQRQRELGAAVESFDRNRLLSASVDELTRYFFVQHQLEVPRLRRADAELDPRSRSIRPAWAQPNIWFSEGARVRGIRYTLHVPSTATLTVRVPAEPVHDERVAHRVGSGQDADPHLRPPGV
jgi:hypothetical protein